MQNLIIFARFQLICLFFPPDLLMQCNYAEKRKHAFNSSCYFPNSEDEVKMDANLLIGMESSLASQCLAFCQALANQGKEFSFSLTINSTFSFSLDTRKSKMNSTLVKKRSSLSTQRRNARRREDFLKKKINFGPLSSYALDTPADNSFSSTPEVDAAPTSMVASSPLPSSPSFSPSQTSPYMVKCLYEDCRRKVSCGSDFMVHMVEEHNGNLCRLCQLQQWALGDPFKDCPCVEQPDTLWAPWWNKRGTIYL